MSGTALAVGLAGRNALSGDESAETTTEESTSPSRPALAGGDAGSVETFYVGSTADESPSAAVDES